MPRLFADESLVLYESSLVLYESLNHKIKFIYLGFYMREVVLNKIQIPDFSGRLAEYEAERAEGAALKDCFDEIHFQTRYVNKLGKYM